MLYVSLLFSVVLLLLSNLIVWKGKHPVHTVWVTVCLGLFCISLPPVFLQAILLGAVVSVWAWRRWRRPTFFALSWSATLIVYAVFGALAFHQMMKLRQEFPYVSLDDRLPLREIHDPAATIPVAASNSLPFLENVFANRDGINDYRASFLRAIHEDVVRIFANQPGFGVTRMPGITGYFLEKSIRREPPILQPGGHSPSPWTPDSLQIGPDTSKGADGLLSLHQGSVLDFVNADNFGFLKDRRHVAGFQEHQISQSPAPSEPWTLQTLDLIGVALHEKPVVYISEFLPRMDELRTAPTRTLDDFEAAGLASLERGEELFVRDRGEERRMLGAIRAVHPCLACHGCERGDLLGAFSYRFTQERK